MILSSTCLPSSLVLEFLFFLPQLFDFLRVKVIENTVQRSSPHKCGQESCCNAFNAVVAAFSQDISASLSLPCTLVVYLHHWNFPQLFDFLRVKVVENTVQKSSPH